MHGLKDQQGQLLLPILVVMFLFGLFWVVYVRWCQKIYWRMRMDMAADAVALSAAREEAAMLNTIGTSQYFENVFLQKAQVGNKEVDAVQLVMEPFFLDQHFSLVAMVNAYTINVMKVARVVAKANGANHSPIPIPIPVSHLKPHGTTVNFMYGPYVEWRQYFRAAYYVRDWRPRIKAPQPIHQTTWLVGHDHIWEKGKARLWLDVDPSNQANNGGFPTEQAKGLDALGIQCNFPQFNARLMTKYFGSFKFDPAVINGQQRSGTH